MPIRRIHFLILALVAMVLSQTYPRLYVSRKVAANSPAMLYPYDSVPQALDSNRVRAIIHDTAEAIRLLIPVGPPGGDTSWRPLDTVNVRRIVHDTAISLRDHTLTRISDSLTANTRSWVTLPSVRSAISDSMQAERTFDTTTARLTARDTATALRVRLADTSAALRAALTDPAEVREIVSDTANILRNYTRYRISDSLSANTRGWTTLPAARSAIHDTAGTLRTLISNAVVKNPTGPQTIVGATLNLERGSALSWALSTVVTGDAYSRWFLQPDGFMGWGPGPADVDVTLMRSGPGVLVLDGSLQVTNLAGTGPRPTYANAAGLVNDTTASGFRGIIGATDTIRTRGIASDTATVLRARLADTSAALRTALTDPGEVRVIVHDTSLTLRTYTTDRIRDTATVLRARLADTSSTLRALIAAREPAISSGTTAQYWRGDKTWAAFPTTWAWSSITGTPTTRAGYGITDAQPLDADLTAIAALATASYGRSLLTGSDAPGVRGLLQARAYYPSDMTNGNANTKVTNGVWTGYSVTNAPNAAWGVLEVWRYQDTWDQIWQEWREADYQGAHVYVRGSADYGATWGTWKQIWDAGNLPVSTYAKTILDDADAATARTTLGAQAALGYTPINKAGDNMLGDLLPNEAWGPGSASNSLGTTSLRWFSVWGKLGDFGVVRANTNLVAEGELQYATLIYPNDVVYDASTTLSSASMSILGSSSDLTFTLPTPSTGRSIKIVVKSSGATGHRIYPAAGHTIIWSGMNGNTYLTYTANPTGISGGYACRLLPGVYEFIGISSTEWALSSSAQTYP